MMREHKHGYNGIRPGEIAISSVYVDLEGVMADLSTALFLHVDRAQLLDEPWPAGESIEDRLGLTKDYLFNLLVRDSKKIWSRVKPYPWALELLSRIRSPCVVVSGSQWGADATYDKLKWCERHLNGRVVDLITVQCRYRLANKEALLIDDSPKTTENFAVAGGHGLVFPQPWNALDDKSVVPPNAILRHVIDQLKKRYLCATISDAQARDLEHGRQVKELA